MNQHPSGHRPKKRFGQNFLEDTYIIQQIVQALHPQKTDNLIEIGPGLGALTKPLLKLVEHLNVIEIDNDLQAQLKTWPEFATDKLKLTAQDALTVDFTGFGKSLRIIGNLPYNISTPLLFHLLQYAPRIRDMHFMLQKEVVMRLAAKPHTKAYGRLTIMAQAQCEVEPLFDVPNTAFRPAPKVDSAVVRLVPHTKQPSIAVLTTLNKLLTKAFSARRKTLNNSLKTLCTAEELEALQIDPTQRIEDISVEKCIKIANFFTKPSTMP